MTDKIIFKGVGYGIQFIELDDDELAKLLKEIEDSEDRFEDILSVKKFSDLYDESYYEYGLLRPSEDYLTLSINAKDSSGLIDGLIAKCEESTFNPDISSQKNLLVYEGLETIEFIYKTDSLDLENLIMSKCTVTLPNGETHILLTPYYNGDGFDYSDATVSGRFRIFDKNRKEVVF
jgi:hypothetical protein